MGTSMSVAIVKEKKIYLTYVHSSAWPSNMWEELKLFTQKMNSTELVEKMKKIDPNYESKVETVPKKDYDKLGNVHDYKTLIDLDKQTIKINSWNGEPVNDIVYENYFFENTNYQSYESLEKLYNSQRIEKYQISHKHRTITMSEYMYSKIVDELKKKNESLTAKAEKVLSEIKHIDYVVFDFGIDFDILEVEVEKLITDRTKPIIQDIIEENKDNFKPMNSLYKLNTDMNENYYNEKPYKIIIDNMLKNRKTNFEKEFEETKREMDLFTQKVIDELSLFDIYKKYGS